MSEDEPPIGRKGRCLGCHRPQIRHRLGADSQIPGPQMTQMTQKRSGSTIGWLTPGVTSPRGARRHLCYLRNLRPWISAVEICV
jgi:hypothetical protein